MAGTAPDHSSGERPPAAEAPHGAGLATRRPPSRPRQRVSPPSSRVMVTPPPLMVGGPGHHDGNGRVVGNRGKAVRPPGHALGAPRARPPGRRSLRPPRVRLASVRPGPAAPRLRRQIELPPEGPATPKPPANPPSRRPPRARPPHRPRTHSSPCPRPFPSARRTPSRSPSPPRRRPRGCSLGVCLQRWGGRLANVTRGAARSADGGWPRAWVLPSFTALLFGRGLFAEAIGVPQGSAAYGDRMLSSYKVRASCQVGLRPPQPKRSIRERFRIRAREFACEFAANSCRPLILSKYSTFFSFVHSPAFVSSAAGSYVASTYSKFPLVFTGTNATHPFSRGARARR